MLLALLLKNEGSLWVTRASYKLIRIIKGHFCCGHSGSKSVVYPMVVLLLNDTPRAFALID